LDVFVWCMFKLKWSSKIAIKHVMQRTCDFLVETFNDTDSFGPTLERPLSTSLYHPVVFLNCDTFQHFLCHKLSRPQISLLVDDVILPSMRSQPDDGLKARSRWIWRQELDRVKLYMVWKTGC
jgi:hypothetical protein